MCDVWCLLFNIQQHFFRSDNDSGAASIKISFNFTNGNSQNLLEPIPAVDIAPDENITITVIPRQAGHVDIVAVAPDNNTE